MIPELYTPDHYATLSEWWKGHEWSPPPPQYLPARGLIIPNHAAAFLYLDPTTKIAAQEFLITNPQNTSLQSYKAIISLTNHIAALARSLGATAIFSSCVQPSLARAMEFTGYQPTDKNVIHLIRPLYS